MEIDSDSDQSATKAKKKMAQSLHTLTSGPISSTLRSLTTSTKSIPSDEDFHFYYNFNEFKTPIKQIIKNTESTLKSISTCSLFSKNQTFTEDDVEEDEGYDWLVNLNDEVWERFDFCVDEFRKVRKLEEESGKRVQDGDGGDDGFQVVYGKKKGKMGNRNVEEGNGGLSAVKTVEKDGNGRSGSVRPKVPFHIPSIVRPQTQFKIVVDNSNEPFEHVWLEKSEDGTRFIHPLEKFTELDFIDRHNEDVELVKPLPVESTPFELVEDVKGLKKLAAKLQDVNEFAVDLEHNHYRSFQGLTCLMQISTRSEDFVVDTLKLHAHVGPHLRDVFKDPSKKKVMHGADRDIVWLQRDFGIYVCNMFDTGQASRVLNLERNSLEYLLHHFCGVTANKEYQSADWRLRPIPSEMLRYAREDTHYLLHIYDLMRVRLREASTDLENIDSLLLEVYKRSYEVCMQLYEKEIQTDTSYLYIYGVQGAELNSQQLAVVAGLCEWRDSIARAEDESTGFVLPNRALIEIARQMPVTAGKLRRLLNSRHPHVERNLGSVVGIIKRSIENAPAFESISQQLQKERAEMEVARNMAVADETEMLMDAEYPTEGEFVSAQESINEEDVNRVSMETSNSVTNTPYAKDVALEVASAVGSETCGRTSLDLSDEGRELMEGINGHPVELRRDNFVLTGQDSTAASVQVLKKPSRAFGALFGMSSSKRKLGADSKVEIKVEQIKSSVSLPFHSFRGGNVQSEPHAMIESTTEPYIHSTEPISTEAGTTNLEDVISLENVSNDDEPSDVARVANDNNLESTETKCTGGSEADTGEKPMSLSELSTSFNDCLQSINQKRNNKSAEKPQESTKYLQLKPFDYAAAREQMKFGEGEEIKKPKEEGGQKNLLHSKERRKNSAISQVPKDTGTKESKQVRRRMAFPPTGNRSATFR